MVLPPLTRNAAFHIRFVRVGSSATEPRMMSTLRVRDVDSIDVRKKSVVAYDNGTVDSGQTITFTL